MKYYEELAAKFDERFKGLEVAELVNEKVRIMKQVSLGGKVIDIVALDTTANEISLYENLGKVTLVDFWGSWCAPCRAESEHLASTYEKYQNEGFQIFGFAIEDSKDKWTKAIAKDNRTWPNTSTLDGYSNEISAEYSITSLPKNFLVDEERVILAKDIHGEELEKMLASLFASP